MTPWHHTLIIHITTPIVAGGDTMSSITEKARAEAEEPSDEQVAQIIEDHRIGPRWIGRLSVSFRCACGHSGVVKHEGLGYSEDDQGPRKIAERAHAVHVAAQLRAARDTGEQG